MNLRRIVIRVLNVIGLILGSINPILRKFVVAAFIYAVTYAIVSKRITFLWKYGYVLSIIYWGLVIAEIIREHCFAIKWYIKKYPKSINCPNCQSHVFLENPQQGRGFDSFPSEYGYGIHEMMVFFFRPRLHLHCPNCGLDEIVCPYCDKPISENDKKANGSCNTISNDKRLTTNDLRKCDSNRTFFVFLASPSITNRTKAQPPLQNVVSLHCFSRKQQFNILTI